MANDTGRPAIPAWQRAPLIPATDDTTSSATVAPASVEDDTLDLAITPAEELSVPSAAPVVVEHAEAMTLSGFEAFRAHQRDQQQQHQPQQAQSLPKPAGPPIITYPEFLVEAHKPPPLITLRRVVNAAYFAGGLGALIYGASKYLVEPMADSVAEARHDFASHTQSKLDDINTRLAGLVSQEAPAHASAPNTDIEDDSSELSDPTELFHRDMGTQTSEMPSRRASDPAIASSAESLPTGQEVATRQSTAITTIKEHLDELTDGMTKQEQENLERQESLSKLRHYLDKLAYASGPGSGWVQGDDGLGLRPVNAGADDAVEEFKKDIRSVKGVLLSARRFPLPRARD